MPKDSAKALKVQRGFLENKFTKFTHFINDPQNQAKKTEIRIRFRKIETILDDFESLTNQIEEITGTPTQEYDEFEKQSYEVTSRAHDLSEIRENTKRSQATHARSTDDAAKIQLPRIDLTTFNGAFEK